MRNNNLINNPVELSIKQENIANNVVRLKRFDNNMSKLPWAPDKIYSETKEKESLPPRKSPVLNNNKNLYTPPKTVRVNRVSGTGNNYTKVIRKKKKKSSIKEFLVLSGIFFVFVIALISAVLLQSLLTDKHYPSKIEMFSKSFFSIIDNNKSPKTSGIVYPSNKNFISTEDNQDVIVNEPDVITFLGVGDFMPGGADIFPGENTLKSTEKLLRKYTDDADISFLNLEGVFTDAKIPVKCNKTNRGKTCYEFGIPERFADTIKESGFDVVNLNNNHSMDFGNEAFDNTLRILDNDQIKHTGAIGDIASFYIYGKKIAVIGFGFTLSYKFYSILELNKAKNIIRELKNENDIVIVSFHGGAEGLNAYNVSNQDEIYLGKNRGNVMLFAKAVIDSGADLVVGHGPHVPRGVELYNNKLIVYSLGNFFTYGRFSLVNMQSFAPMIKIALDKNTGDFVRGNIIPFVQKEKGIPFYDKNNMSIKFINQITSDNFPDNPLKISNNGDIEFNGFSQSIAKK